MRRTTTRAAAIGLLLAALAAPAPAADAPETAADLLRAGQAAESADRDASRAAVLYLRAVEAGGTTDVARDALLRLMDLASREGSPDALAHATCLWTTFGDRLPADDARRVEAVLTRLLPEGRTVEGPRGVFVVASGRRRGESSPVEETILEQLRTLKGLEGGRRADREAEIERTLTSVGRDALPALERAIVEEGPDVGPFAARLVAATGGVDAIPALGRILRGPDPFARSAARDALVRVAWSEENRAAYAAAMEPLLDVPALAPERDGLRASVADALTPAEVYARSRAGGPEASWWLGQAVARLHQPALDDAIERGRGGDGLDETALQQVGRAYGTVGFHNYGNQVVVLPALDAPARDRLRVLGLLASQPTSQAVEEALLDVATVAYHHHGDVPAEHAADVAWRHVLGLADDLTRHGGVVGLLHRAVPPPPSVLREFGPALGRALRFGWTSWGLDVSRAALLGPAQRAEPALWDALADAMEHATSGDALAGWVRAVGRAIEADAVSRGSWTAAVPPALDATALRLLPALGALPSTRPDETPWPYAAAVRTGDPAVLSWARAWLAHPPPGPAVSTLRDVLGKYEGPGRLEFALDGLTDVALWNGRLLAAAASHRDFWDGFFARASSWDGRTLQDALGRLGVTVLSDVLDRPPTRRGKQKTPPPGDPSSRFVEAGASPAWVPLLRRAEVNWDELRTKAIAILAAASGSPGYLSLVEEVGRDPKAPGPLVRDVFAALPYFVGEIPVPWLERLASDPEFHVAGSGVTYPEIAQLLWSDPSPEASAARQRLARLPHAPAGGRWLASLADGDVRAIALEVLDAYRKEDGARWPDSYRGELVALARRLKLKEAIPFLLTEYQGPSEGPAAEALDAIRAYHERLARFQSWAEDLAQGRRDLGRLLEDPDPQIRRAAVLSLGALGDEEALPALVRIAKEEKDPTVRAAALEAVERIARAHEPRRAPAPTGPQEPR